MSVVKLIIDNSYSEIHGLNVSQFNKLKKLLSYNTDSQTIYFAGGNYPRIKHCIDKRGSFPSGLIYRVKKHLATEKIKHLIEDRRKQPALNKPQAINPTIKPYKWQLDACAAAVKAHRGIISATTGSGKSLVIALIAARLNVRTLVVVPSLEIKKQLTASLENALNDTSNIIVENIDSKRLNNLKGIDCLIIDEAHHAAAKTYRELNKRAWVSVYYRFFLTATPFRNNSDENLLFEGVAGIQKYALKYSDAVNNGFIVPIEAYYIELPKREVAGFTWAQVYKELVTDNTFRNETIAKLMLNLNASGVSTLCLVKEVAHGKKIQALTDYSFATGAEDESRGHIHSFNELHITSLIGTTGIIGEGVDTRPAEYIIIAGLGKARSAFIQNCGRGVRRYKDKESAKIIIFKDMSHKFTSRHFKAQCRILKDEYNVIPIKLEIE